MCAYNPGVTDISGQLRAQGQLAKVQGISEGFSNGFQTYQQNRMRNQVLQGENEGLLQAFLNDPETKKYAPEGIDKFLTKVEKGGGLTLDDNIRLNGMLNSALKTKGAIADQNAKTQQMALQQQQIAESKSQQAQQAFVLQQEQMKAQQQAVMDQRNQQLAQYGGGVGQGVLKPEAQAQMNAQMQTNPQALLLARALQQTKDPGVIREIIQANEAKNLAGTPTTAMRDADAIINAELKAGMLNPSNVEARRAQLLASGGSGNAPQKFQNGSHFVSADGKYLGASVFDQTTGEYGLRDPKSGKIAPIPEGAEPITATGIQKQIPDISTFRKFKSDVTDAEISLRNMERYIKSVGDAPSGIDRLAAKFSAGIKTLVGKKDLDPKELAAKMAQGQLQGLLGANRTNVVGGGVMTEQDALRIIQRLGGDFDSLSNPQVVRDAIAQVYSDRFKQYEDGVNFYNGAVKDFYGARGHKEVPKKDFTEAMKVFDAPDAAPVVAPVTAPATASPLPPGWSIRP